MKRWTRDEIAVVAVVGLSTRGEYSAEHIAQRAYQIADAMLAAQAQSRDGGVRMPKARRKHGGRK